MLSLHFILRLRTKTPLNVKTPSAIDDWITAGLEYLRADNRLPFV
jgi:hypothetical protein